MKLRVKRSLKNNIVKFGDDEEVRILFAGSIVDWDEKNEDDFITVTDEDGREFVIHISELEIVEKPVRVDQKIEINQWTPETDAETGRKFNEQVDKTVEDIRNRIERMAGKHEDDKWLEYLNPIEASLTDLEEGLDSLESRFDEFLSGKSFKVEYNEEGGLFLRGIATPNASLKRIKDDESKPCMIVVKDLRLGDKIKFNPEQPKVFTVTSLEHFAGGIVTVGYVDEDGYTNRSSRDELSPVTVVE